MSFEKIYEIIKNNDESYDLKFYYAVKSTGIYCKPSCKSKLPKKENIVIFKNSKEALENGYRACKRCRSDLVSYKPNKELADNLKMKIEKYYAEKELLKKEISNLGLTNKRIVEIFKEEFNITPSEYINNLRINLAKKLILNSNDKIVDIAYRTGFNSLSAFYRIFKDKEKITPAKYRIERNRS